MAHGGLVILSAGGLRSLVATGLLVERLAPEAVTLLYVSETRPNAAMRIDYLHRQARHYKINQTLEIDLPQARLRRSPDEPAGVPRVALGQPLVVLAALAQTIETGAQRLIWPAQCDGEFRTIARVTELVELLSHACELDQPDAPPIETPLLELTDRQLIEVGGQLDVPWQLAWTCQHHSEAPCRNCPACRRRHAAFEAAGIVDPIEHVAMAG